MDALKPFENIGSFYDTRFPNVVLDMVQPLCAPSEWKALSMIIRYTAGFEDTESESGRRERTPFSTRFCMIVCGFKSKATAEKALEGLRIKKMVKRDKGERRDQPDIYYLNPDYLLHNVPTNGKLRKKGAPESGAGGAPNSRAGGGTENGAGGAPESGAIKRKGKNNKKRKKKNGHNHYCACEECLDNARKQLTRRR